MSEVNSLEFKFRENRRISHRSRLDEAEGVGRTWGNFSSFMRAPIRTSHRRSFPPCPGRFSGLLSNRQVWS
jgi:hypothetical protein